MTIEVKTDEYTSLIQRKKIFNMPIIRGAVTLIEVMILGIKTLQWSADKAMEDVEEEEIKKGKKPKKKKKQGMSTASAIFTVAIALSIGIGMFFILPLYLTTEIFNIEKEALLFNFVSGLIRIVFFLLYVWGISFMKDVKRLFQYHGAEHKSIFAFEDKVFLSAPKCAGIFNISSAVWNEFYCNCNVDIPNFLRIFGFTYHLIYRKY